MSKAYADKIITTFGANLVALWPLWETAGATANDYTANARNGTHRNDAGVLNGVTLGQTGIGTGRTSTLYDGTNGYTSIYSAGLAGAFNGAEGTVFGWFKCAAQTDTGMIIQLRYNGNNLVSISKSQSGGDGRLSFNYYAGSGSNNLLTTLTGVSDTTFVFAALTWSKSNDRAIPYFKGVQAAATMTGLGVFAGAIANGVCNLGCANNATPTTPFKGNLAYVGLCDREATPAEILALANFSGAAAFTQTSWSIPRYALNTPAVMITFDDEYESVYTQAFKAIMEPQDYRGTFYVMTSAINGTNDPPYVTDDELLEMDAAGWSIGNHTITQPALADLSIADATAEMAGAKTALDAIGLTKASMHVAYPLGSWDSDVTTAAIAAGMLTGRRTSAAEPVWPTYLAADNYESFRTQYRFGNADTIVGALAIIDAAIAAGKTAVFYGHKIVTPATDATEWEPWKLQALINYIGLKNLPCLTVNDFYDLQSGPKTITRNPPA